MGDRVTLPERRLPIGAEPVPGGTNFRVWAPGHESVAVILEKADGSGRDDLPAAAGLPPEPGGYFSGTVPGVAAGDLYRLRLDGREGAGLADPASRFQPKGPDGPSMVVDPAAFAWTDGEWPGVRLAGQVLYELHVGAFTPEGTWEAAGRVLPELAETGISLLEVMPVADFAGRFGWGYDGVDMFAPTRLYGTPDDFRRFVDRAHGLGLGVILDVVYNHFGPSGCVLGEFSKSYYTKRHRTEWGDAVNYDDENSGPVREFIVANAGYWIDEFHLDGLRLDATHAIQDLSPEHVVAELARRARERAGRRPIVVIAENEPQDARMLRPPAGGGLGLDGLMNDDFHHSARVALTGRSEAYYGDFRGTAQELLSAVLRGFLYQGQRSGHQRRRRGRPALDLEPYRFVHFLENHDQVANSARGERLGRLAAPGDLRALTALLLLAPETPLLFMGQEFGASSPFCYFADHDEGLSPLVREGRAEELARFPSLADSEVRAALPDPGDPRTFERCKLDPAERERNVAERALHQIGRAHV